MSLKLFYTTCVELHYKFNLLSIYIKVSYPVSKYRIPSVLEGKISWITFREKRRLSKIFSLTGPES